MNTIFIHNRFSNVSTMSGYIVNRYSQYNTTSRFHRREMRCIMFAYCIPFQKHLFKKKK